MGERRVERPEGAGDAQRVLRHRLGHVAAGRRDRADHGDRADTVVVVAAQRLHATGALVEGREPGREVRRVAFLAGHLLESAGDLAERLAPPGGRVGHHGDVVAHVAVVLGQRGAHVDGGLAGGDRHVRRVGDEHGAVHERSTRARVLELRELGEDLGHLVAALAAADVDDDVDVGPLRQRLLRDRLARAEAARDDGVAAEGDREERVEDPHAGGERRRRVQLLDVGAALTDRPALAHPNLGAVGERGDSLVHVEVTLAHDRCDGSGLHGRRDHDLVDDGLPLRNRAEHVAAARLRRPPTRRA